MLPAAFDAGFAFGNVGHARIKESKKDAQDQTPDSVACHLKPVYISDEHSLTKNVKN